MKKIIVLFYNRMWDQPFSFDEIRIPYPFVFTTFVEDIDEADVVVFHMPSLKFSRKLQKRPGQLWVFWSMECEQHYPRLNRPDVLGLFDIFMTYKADADITVPYLTPQHAQALRGKPSAKTNLINSFISSSIDESGRVRLVKQLISLLPIDSYGRLFNNKKIECDNGFESKMSIISRYKFTLALENAVAEDYVTEKFYDPLVAGSIPVYLGAPNINEFAPGQNCFIDIRAFASVRQLADYLLRLNMDDDLYNQYFTWKGKPYERGFMKKLDEVELHPFMRLCQRVKKKLPYVI